MVNRREFLIVSLGLVFLLLGPTVRISNAIETPESVLKKFNASLTFDGAVKYITGRMKAQLTGLDKETREKALKNSRMKNYKALTLPVTENLQTVIVTDVKFIDEKRPRLIGPIHYKFINEDGQWKIEWFQSGSALLELYTRKIDPHQFHSLNLFEISGRTFNMESAFASYKEEGEKEKTWINIKFYPFEFHARDLEFLKYNSGPIVVDKDKPKAIASSMKYPNIWLDILTDMKGQVKAFSLGLNYLEEGKEISMTISPPVDKVGLKKFVVSQNWLTLVAAGKGLRNSDGRVEQWNINIVGLPLLKEGL